MSHLGEARTAKWWSLLTLCHRWGYEKGQRRRCAEPFLSQVSVVTDTPRVKQVCREVWSVLSCSELEWRRAALVGDLTRKWAHELFKRAILTFHLPNCLSREPVPSRMLRLLEYWVIKRFFFKRLFGCRRIFQSCFAPQLLLVSVESVNKFPLAANNTAVQLGQQEGEGKADERCADSFSHTWLWMLFVCFLLFFRYRKDLNLGQVCGEVSWSEFPLRGV